MSFNRTKEQDRAATEQKARDIWMGLGQLRRALDDGEPLAEVRQRINDLVGQAGHLVGQLAPKKRSDHDRTPPP